MAARNTTAHCLLSMYEWHSVWLTVLTGLTQESMLTCFAAVETLRRKFFLN